MSEHPRILVVDDEESLRHMLSLALSKDGFHVWTASSGKEALHLLRGGESFEVCVTDVRMPGMDGLALIEDAVKTASNPPTFVAMSAYGDEELAVEALRRGAFDYISKPFPPQELSLKLRLVIERRRLGSDTKQEGGAPQVRTKQPASLEDMVTISKAMEQIFRTVRKVANFPTTVLITGETGTGKERIAGAIHREGNRKNRPFVAVNVAAIPDTLLESELFGHVQGAFTDANQDRAGLFEVAHGGTLFLDEIGELSPSLQVKLLRALVEKEIRRVGSSDTVPIDVRVVAATSRKLEARVKEGAFREDLFYRLNVVSVHLPALRDRPEDVSVLADHFATKLAKDLGLGEGEITPDAMTLLEGYSWPGNVRELENAIERALVLSDGTGRITAADLDDRFDVAHRTGDLALPADLLAGADLPLKAALARVERLLIRRALEQTGGNRTKAAGVLGISHRALLYKLKEYEIS